MSNNAGFEKVSTSDQTLYGPRKLLLAGFSASVQDKFKILLDMMGLSTLPLVWLSASDLESRLSDLVKMPDGSGLGLDSELPRTLIVCGVMEKELHLLMNGCRKTGMKQALWAVLTPTSETWPLKALINELAAERDAFEAQKQKDG